MIQKDFSFRWDDRPRSDTSGSAAYLDAMDGFGPSEYVSACFKPLRGLFGRHKYTPLMWRPITLEFEIVPNATDAVVSSIVGGVFTPTNTSTDW